MPNVSEEELQQLREHNAKLRKDIADANSKQAENEANRQRELEAIQLGAEAARLEGQLARAKEAAKVTTSREGAATLVESAKERLKQEQQAAEQPVGPVDTNEGRDTDTDKKDGGN